MLRLLGLFVLAVSAGNGQARYEVSGKVVDPSGLPVPSATVILARSGSGVHLENTTGDEGSFHFEGVAAGEYSLEVRQAGFSSATRRVRVDRDRKSVRLQLSIEKVRAEVTVSGRESAELSADPAENRDAVTMDRRLLDDLPVMDQDILGAVEGMLDPGVTSEEGMTVVVDGMETADIGVTPSAIEEVRINRNPYSAEHSRPGRGRVEIITKQGSSEFHGTFNALMRDYRLDARNAFAAEKPRQQRREYEGHFTGPLEKSGKTTFLVSAEREEDDEEAVVFARTLDGIVQQNFPSPERETELSARVNHYIGDHHSLSFRYRLDRENQSGSGVGGFRLPEAGYETKERRHRFYVNHRWFANPKWLTELSVRFGRESEQSKSLLPGIRGIEVQDAFTAGGAQADERRTEDEVEWAYVISRSGDKHFVRAGFLVPDLSRSTVDDRDNFDGAYRFASLEDYEAGRPFSFTQSQGQSRLTYWVRRWAGFVQDDIRLRPNVTLGLGLRYDRQKFLPDSNNFAPRVSVAWGLGDKSQTVIRAGTGVFYDRTGSRAVREVLLNDGVRLRQLVLADPAYPDPAPAGGGLPAVPPNIVRFAPDLRTPYVTQYSFGIERTVHNSLAVSASFTGVRGTKQFRSLDLNAPLPPLWERPDPSVGVLRQIESSATMKGQSLNLTLRGSIGGVFRGTVLYRLGRTYNDTGGRDDLPPDSYDLSREWSRADFDRRHRFRMFGSFAMPKDVSLGLMFWASSGRPYELTTGLDNNRDGMAIERPEGVLRNSLEQPGAATLNVRLSREFRLGGNHLEERATMRLALDAFNALNRVNVTRVVGNLSSPFFGGPVGARWARRLQVSLKLSF